MQLTTTFTVSALFVLSAASCGTASEQGGVTATKPAASEVPAEPKSKDSKSPESASSSSASVGSEKPMEFAEKIANALMSDDATAFVALAMTPKEFQDTMMYSLDACPDRPRPPDVEAQLKQASEELLGTDDSRITTYSQHFADCKKFGDFKGVKVKNLSEHDRIDTCGGSKIGNLVFELASSSTSIWVRVNDSLLTKDGWRMPDPIWCSSEKPE